MGREALDDLARRRRDREANSEFYQVVGHSASVRSRDLKVGDLIKVMKNQRVPADIMLLRTGDGTGEAFIRTDQLDGETDWKLKTALGVTQNVSNDGTLINQNLTLTAEPPMKDIHKLNATLVQHSIDSPQEYGVGIDNMMWANTVLASGPYSIGVVVYTGIETRQAQNTSKARIKFGLLEHEINTLSKVPSLSSKAYLDTMCAHARSQYTARCLAHPRMDMVYIYPSIPYSFFHDHSCEVSCSFVSHLIISLRVNLDLSKMTYAYQIERDKDVTGTIVRTSTIPEELGRIEYLFTDKTGTITKNGN
jgi:phospholipid-translocating ATPase